MDNPGWGYVNHSSYVHMTDNVSFAVRGAAFNTEVGDELGSFIGNTAILSGLWDLGDPTHAPLSTTDFTSNGGSNWGGNHGFWFQGLFVNVEDNVVSGAGNGFGTYGSGLYQNMDGSISESEYLQIPKRLARDFPVWGRRRA